MALLRIVCLSETQGDHGKVRVPDGDVLVVAGDCTAQDTFDQHLHFLNWVASHPHPDKVLIAGDRDGSWASRAWSRALLDTARRHGISYLEQSGTHLTHSGLVVWGSPWSPASEGGHFMYPRASPRADDLWAMIPEGLDLLVTHGPPLGALDEFHGCEALAARLASINAPPRLHVFSHERASGGRHGVGGSSVNASVRDGGGVASSPVVVDLPSA